MRKLLLLIALMLTAHTLEAKDKVVPFVSIGAGYKITEKLEIRCYGSAAKDCGKYKLIKSHPITARFDAGIEYNNWKFGVTHHSQYFQGPPLESLNTEYAKNEIYVDYVWRWE